MRATANLPATPLTRRAWFLVGRTHSAGILGQTEIHYPVLHMAATGGLVDYAECPLPTPLARVLESGLAWCLFLSDRVHTAVPYLALVPPCLSFTLLLCFELCVIYLYPVTCCDIVTRSSTYHYYCTVRHILSQPSIYIRRDLYFRIHPLFQSQ
jgi:hypothetical protein